MKKSKYIFWILGIILVLFGSYFVVQNKDVFNEIQTEKNENVEIYSANNIKVSQENLKVYFIDVGQADSILIEQAGHFMLIDAGNNDDGNLVVDFLKSKGVTKLDYIIGTHPHEDHIGGIDNVISSFDEENIFFPKTTSTTKTFEDFVNAVKSKNKKLYAPVSGEEFTFANSTFKVLAPNSEKYDEANNYSIVLKLTYKNKSFLFTGDAETLAENEILDKGYDIKSDLIKIGHHGSSSSTSNNFLKAVDPDYAVISVGKDNSYNHPRKAVMDRLKRYNIPVYRTDELSTITVTSDGENISFDKECGTYNYMK